MEECTTGITITQTAEECSGNYVSTNCVSTPNAITYLDLSAGASQTSINAALTSALMRKDEQIVAIPVPDGSETKVVAGVNVTVTGTGTNLSPYVVNTESAGSIEVTYNELTTLISTSSLVTGSTYLLTDYMTTYTQPVTLVSKSSGIIEPLFITALDVNKLSNITYSQLYPQDIVYYEVTGLTYDGNQEEFLTEGFTKGKIYRRVDTLLNNDIGTDWRHVKYNRGGIDKLLFEDYTDCYNNTIKSYALLNTTIGNAFHSNTIGNNFHSNTIGNNFRINTISDDFALNTIGNYFLSNTISDSFYSNTIGDFFISNTISDSFTSNIVGNDRYNNIIGRGIYNMTLNIMLTTIKSGFNSQTLTMYNNTTLVGNLPTNAPTGQEFIVSDAVSPTYLGALTGGGIVITPVWYNGTTWISR